MLGNFMQTVTKGSQCITNVWNNSFLYWKELRGGSIDLSNYKTKAKKNVHKNFILADKFVSPGNMG